MSHFLFVIDQLPFPPINGTRIPIYRYITGLRARHQVSVLYIPACETVRDRAFIEDNKELVDEFWRIEQDNRQRIFRDAYTFLRGRVPVYRPQRIDMQACRNAIGGKRFDFIVCTSFRTCSLLPQVEACLSPQSPHRIVGAINDALGLTIQEQSHRLFSRRYTWKSRAMLALHLTRLPGLIEWERKWLENTDYVLVQTPRDKAWFRAIYSMEQSRRVHVCSNCPDPDLFLLPIERSGKIVRFIGRLDYPNHAAFVSGVLKRVWPQIVARHPDAELRILGRPGPSRLMRQIASSNRVYHDEFVKDLRDVHRSASILLLHRQGRMGIINRVLEAMAAGVVVLGDPGAFNGIVGFRDWQHGVVGTNLDKVARVACHLLDKPEETQRIGGQARMLMHNRFRWEGRIRLIESALGIGQDLTAPDMASTEGRGRAFPAVA